MRDIIELKRKSQKDLKTGNTIVIQEYFKTYDVARVFDPQSGSRLVITPRYAVKIYQSSSGESINQISKTHHLCLTMDECYEEFPWFFSND